MVFNARRLGKASAQGRLTFTACVVVAMIALGLTACGEDTIDPADSEVTFYLTPSHNTPSHNTLESSGTLGTPEVMPNTTITLPSGATVTVQKALIALTTLEVQPCSRLRSGLGADAQLKPAQADGFGQWQHRFMRLVMQGLVPTAQAHTGSTPTLSGVPYWLDLTAPVEQFMAVLYPPLNDYCQLALSFGRADADTTFTQGADRAPSTTQALVGTTFLLEGTYTPANSQVAEPLLITTTKNLPPAVLSLGEALSAQGLQALPISAVTVAFDMPAWLAATEDSWRQARPEEALVLLHEYWLIKPVEPADAGP